MKIFKCTERGESQACWRDKVEFLSSVLLWDVCSSRVFNQDHAHAISPCRNSREIQPASIGSTCVWCIIPCIDANRFWLFLNLPCKSNKSLSLLCVSFFGERRFFCKANLCDS